MMVDMSCCLFYLLSILAFHLKCIYIILGNFACVLFSEIFFKKKKDSNVLKF